MRRGDSSPRSLLSIVLSRSSRLSRRCTRIAGALLPPSAPQLELMLLGMLSPLLQVAQEGLLKICVKYASASGDDHSPAARNAVERHAAPEDIFIGYARTCSTWRLPSRARGNCDSGESETAVTSRCFR